MILQEYRRVRLDSLDPDAALALLADVGLTGHGGGGFPAATKIAAARGRRADFIVNGCDGEPLVAKDAALLAGNPMLVADGIDVVQRILRPISTMIAVHHGSAAEAAAHALIGAAGSDATVLPVPIRYVSSEASALASLARGGEARPSDHEHPLTDGFPASGRRPVVVLNLETVARVAAVLVRGVATPTRLLSLAGDVHSPRVIEAALDLPLGRLVEAAQPVATPKAVLVGGYGGRWYPWEQLRSVTPAQLGRDLGAGLVLMHSRGCPLRLVSGLLDYLAAETAGQCGPCMFGLPAIAADWAELIDPGRAVTAETRLRRRLPMIAGRGACAHPDGAVTMAASALATFEADIRSHRAGRCVAAPAHVPVTR